MLKNFIWQREDQPQNMLSYIFLFIQICYGITFAFFPSSKIVMLSPLYMYFVSPMLWGFLCLIVVAITLFAIATRNRLIGEQVGLMGILVWGYGLFLYLSTGNLFASLVVYLPQVLFWIFWGIGVKRFYGKEDLNGR